MNEKFKKFTKIHIIYVFLPLVLFASCKMVESRKFHEDWNERFSSAVSLNNYAAMNDGSIYLSKVKLEHHKVERIRIDDFTVKNGLLSNIELSNSKIDTLTIIDSDIQMVDFSDSTISQLTIQGSNLEDFYCKRCKISQIRFLNSSLRKVDLRIKDNIKSIILDCYFDDSSFYSSKIKDFEIINAKFSKNESFFDYLETDYLLIKDSSLNVDLKESKIKTTVLENVTGHWAGFARLKGDTFVIKDSDLYALSLGGSASELKHFESSNSSFEELSFRNVKHSGKVIIKNCPKTSGFIFTKALLKKVSFESCNFDRVRFDKSTVDEIVFSNVQLYSPYARFDGKWDLMDVNTFTLDNVFIQGHFNMEDARIGKLVKKNLRKSENLEINYKGANFKL